MRYKILNYLFGWDYVQFETYFYKEIRRVETLYDGTPVVYHHHYKKLDELTEVVFLTCFKEKYLL